MLVLNRSVLSVAALLISAPLLNGCQISNGSAHNDSPVIEAACSETVKIFDSGSAPALALTALPAGVYTFTSGEIYVQSKTVLGDGTADISEVQFLATAVAGAALPETGIRCRETTGTFRPYFDQLALIANFSRLNSGDFDVVSTSFAVNYSVDLLPTLSVGNAGDQRTNPGTIANTISSNWNGGYHFVRSGETYAFYGTRTEASTGRTIYGKASFTRSALPAGSP